ncbi:GNAT family N-acetyltransferase [Luteimonas saliphila]|uniref:GNAT family N-acetyltransferase n=1 Tax=Luteimonas saliphila TaxID=2804919 RepID=UPI00192D4A47|nr:GNAT family N-acetyltransferase [Luteimonas saliphila]
MIAPPPALSGHAEADFAIESGRCGPLRVCASTRGDAVFDRFFAAYDHAFVLPDEKEGRDGFLACLALNHGDAQTRLLARFGPFREWVLVAERDGDVVGGANFICHAVAAHDGAPQLAMNLNYVFVTPAHRGRGHLRDMVAASRRLARMSFAGAGADADTLSLRMFIELNDPLLMEADAYALDNAVAGIDQFDRVAVWARLGARILDFPYLQPPLSKAQAADSGLMLGVVDAPGTTLDACVLGAHLERFFAISVLKDGDPRAQPATRAQLDLCAGRCAQGGGFALLDPLPHLPALRAESGREAPRRGFRERLAGLATG